MTDWYIKVDGAGSATGHISRETPLEGYNTASDSAVNGKPYLVPATLTDASPNAFQVKSGPAYDVNAGTITYSVAYKSLANAKDVRKDQIDAQRDTLLKAGITINSNTYSANDFTLGDIALKRDRISRKGGAAVKSITGINTSTDTVSVSGGAVENGNEVEFADVGGTVELNGNVYFTANKSGNSFTLKDRLGNDIDMAGFGTYTSGGTATVVGTLIGKDNNIVALPFGDVETVADTLSEWRNRMYEQGRVYKNDVDALSTAADVAAHTDGDDNSDWPA